MSATSSVPPEGHPSGPAAPPGADRLNHAAITREGREPSELPRGIPWLLALLTGALGAWGATYFWFEAGDGDPHLGDGRTPTALAAPAAGAGVDGEAVYTARCAACHQANGAGVPGAFPPLAGSEWVTGDPRLPVTIVLHGLSGPIEVGGTAYQGAMPPLGDQLSDAEVAAVVSYVRSAWGNEAPPVEPSLVAEVRRATAGRSGPIGGQDELKRLFR